MYAQLLPLALPAPPIPAPSGAYDTYAGLPAYGMLQSIGSTSPAYWTHLSGNPFLTPHHLLYVDFGIFSVNLQENMGTLAKPARSVLKVMDIYGYSSKRNLSVAMFTRILYDVALK
jgi:hypothetical protein